MTLFLIPTMFILPPQFSLIQFGNNDKVLIKLEKELKNKESQILEL
jgi:hypothetical protein